MRIELNGELREVGAEGLSDVLQECGYAHTRIATAVNGEFVHKTTRAAITLKEGDRLEVIAPIAGG